MFNIGLSHTDIKYIPMQYLLHLPQLTRLVMRHSKLLSLPNTRSFNRRQLAFQLFDNEFYCGQNLAWLKLGLPFDKTPKVVCKHPPVLAERDLSNISTTELKDLKSKYSNHKYFGFR